MLSVKLKLQEQINQKLNNWEEVSHSWFGQPPLLSQESCVDFHKN